MGAELYYAINKNKFGGWPFTISLIFPIFQKTACMYFEGRIGCWGLSKRGQGSTLGLYSENREHLKHVIELLELQADVDTMDILLYVWFTVCINFSRVWYGTSLWKQHFLPDSISLLICLLASATYLILFPLWVQELTSLTNWPFTNFLQVLSVTLDEWSDEDIDAMVEVGGNAAANAIYEAFIPEGVSKPGPDASHDDRRRFIRFRDSPSWFSNPCLVLYFILLIVVVLFSRVFIHAQITRCCSYAIPEIKLKMCTSFSLFSFWSTNCPDPLSFLFPKWVVWHRWIMHVGYLF